MDQWVSIYESHGYQVCVEKGVTSGMPSIIFRMRKDGGELRSQMVVERDASATLEEAIAERDYMWGQVTQELVDGAVEHMLAMEPDLMDGSQHAFVVEGD
ncbi:hypothetical protein Q6670_004035 [Salmonella enterica]|nr:hypothetical protein [Salmonella enterica]